MPVPAKSNGIVLRMLIGQTIGVRLNAVYGDAELVVGLNPVRLIMSEAPAWVEAWVMDWVRRHEKELLPLEGGVAHRSSRLAGTDLLPSRALPQAKSGAMNVV